MFQASCFLQRIFSDFGGVIFGLYSGDPHVAAGHSAGVGSLFLSFFFFQECVLYVFVCVLFSLISLCYLICFRVIVCGSVSVGVCFGEVFSLYLYRLVLFNVLEF